MPFRILNHNVGHTTGAPEIACEPEVLFFEVRGRHFALDVNSLCLIQVDPDLRARIEASVHDEEAGSDVFCSRRCLNAPLHHAPTIFVELAVTTDCNLACRYCYEREAVQSRPAYMDAGLAKEALEKLFTGSAGDPRRGPAGDPNQRDRAHGTYRVCFFGGEPLLNWALIEEIVPWFRDWAEKRGHPVQFSTTTNGTLLDEAKARFLVENKFEMIVSLDGPPAVHNDYRPFKGPAVDSYNATITGLRTLQAAGYPMSRLLLRATFTGEGVDLRERARHLADYVERGLAGSISVEPSCLSEQGCATLPEGHSLAFRLDKLDALLRYEYAQTAEWLSRQYLLGKRLYFHHFSYMIARLLYAERHATECGAGRGYLSVGVDGSIYPCHRHHYPPIGSVTEGGVDQRRAAPWIDNRWYARKSCPECPLRWACGGGCRMDSALLRGDILEPDPISCWFKRVFVEEAAWIMSEVGPAKLAELIPRNR